MGADEVSEDEDLSEIGAGISDDFSDGAFSISDLDSDQSEEEEEEERNPEEPIELLGTRFYGFVVDSDSH